MSVDQYSRANVVGLLSNMGYPDLAAEASRALPDPVDINQLSQWMFDHGLTHDDLISQMGGSP
jgi:hypothetical protein